MAGGKIRIAGADTRSLRKIRNKGTQNTLLHGVIVPFCTHEGSGLSSTEESIAAACPDAEILDGLSIRGSVAQNSQEEAAEAVAEWLRQVGFIE